ncbi:zinc finger protein 227 [Anopheles gambiae]|uniref:zinc finger protein 227 n=1 Tax=Anopheles gambiae TaxID=7165 RepID=UPI002AC9A7DD|nr:zinc finger protein 227 [Anopheles gambiae]
MAEDLSINKNKIFTQRYGNSNNDICRLCLKNEAHMEPLFYANLFPNILLTKKIYDCTSIQIIYERNLPMFVCKLCANKLDEYVRFRDRCIANDEFLRNALAAFDANGGGNCPGAIKMEPDDIAHPAVPPQPPASAKFSQCLAVTPLELNCALVAAAAAAAGKREPPDIEEEDEERGYGHGSGAPSPDRSACGRVDELTVKRPHSDEPHYHSGDEDDELLADDGYDGEPNQTPAEHADQQQYVCEVCSKSFKIRHHLLVHRHTHVDSHAPTADMLHERADFNGATAGAGGAGGKPSYSCPKCPKAFVNKGNLLNHLETHTHEKSYACDICTKTFKYNVQLRLHMRIHTGERPHKCEICNRGFSQLSNLRSHRKTHSKVKPYKCHLCLKSFTMLDNLTAHSAKCLKDKFRCTLCSKSFAKEGNLLSHLQSHSDGIVEKMFKCEMCPKSFKNKEDWKRHVRVHTGEKPYTCDICSKGFAQKANLLSHRKTHLKPNVTYSCDRCARTFRSQKVLQMHVPKCTGGAGPIEGASVPPSAPVTPVSESIPDSPSPGAGVSLTTTSSSAVEAAANSTPPTLSEALSDLLRYEIALRAPLELQQMLLGHIDRKGKPAQAGPGGKAAGRRYRCDVCFKGYSQYPSLIKHRKLHFKVPPLVKVLAGKAGHHHQQDYEDGEMEEPSDGLVQPPGELHCRGVGGIGDAPPQPPPLPLPPPHHQPTGEPIERPYSCDICGGRFAAASAHPPDRCRQELQLRLLCEPVPVERGPEAAPPVAHRRAAVPVHPLSEGVYAAVEPAGPREDPRPIGGAGVQQVGSASGRMVPMGPDVGSVPLHQPTVASVEPACVT